MRVALNCWGDVPTGLGSEARWLWSLLPFDVWLRAEHPILGLGELIHPDGRSVRSPTADDVLADVDVLVAVERTLPESLAQEANASGVHVVLLCNPEYASPRKSWWGAARPVARTPQCQRLLAEHGLDAPVVPVPVDLREFPFVEREQVRTVRFTNGFGGLQQRRGWPEVAEAVRLGADVEVYSARPLPGVEHVGQVARSRDLYAGADLVLVPSRFEGLGLSILEAMACGALVMTTDAEPMRDAVLGAYGDYAELFLLPCSPGPSVKTSAHDAWPTWRVAPDKMVDRIADVCDLPEDTVRRLSQAGREYVARVHGASAATALWRTINENGGGVLR